MRGVQLTTAAWLRTIAEITALLLSRIVMKRRDANYVSRSFVKRQPLPECIARCGDIRIEPQLSTQRILVITFRF